jgi:3-mercaptopyruvate sulfurtransferase SseA
MPKATQSFTLAIGFLAGAQSIPYPSVLDEEKLTFKDEETLRGMFAEAGVEPGDTVVTYCHIGQQASTARRAPASKEFGPSSSYVPPYDADDSYKPRLRL